MTGAILCGGVIAVIALIAVLWIAAARLRRLLLARFGIDTPGTITESVQYQGHGWHDTDPCFKGRYTFTDRRGKTHAFGFARYCFDYNDYRGAKGNPWAEFQAMFAVGAAVRVRYVRGWPRLHRVQFRRVR